MELKSPGISSTDKVILVNVSLSPYIYIYIYIFIYTEKIYFSIKLASLEMLGLCYWQYSAFSSVITGMKTAFLVTVKDSRGLYKQGSCH